MQCFSFLRAKRSGQLAAQPDHDTAPESDKRVVFKIYETFYARVNAEVAEFRGEDGSHTAALLNVLYRSAQLTDTLNDVLEDHIEETTVTLP